GAFFSVEKKSHMTYNEKCSNYHFRKTPMEQLNLITNFLRIKDKNITITDEYDMGTHLELNGYWDYKAPKCPKSKEQRPKNNNKKPPKIPNQKQPANPYLTLLVNLLFNSKKCV